MTHSVDAKRIRKLPTSATRWEVAMVEIPVTVRDVELDGVLLVVEQDTWRVRGAGPVARGAPLLSALDSVLFQPVPPSIPSRPLALLCANGALAARLRTELRGTGIAVEQVDEVPAAREAAEALLLQMNPLRAPGITAELPLWAGALGTLCRIAPWRRLPDSVRFSFGAEVPGLERAVAVVMGLAGEQEGVVLYPSAEDHDRFLALASAGDLEIPVGISAFCLYLDPEGELEPEESAAVREAGLSLPGGRAPRALALRGGAGRPLSDPEQSLLLAAIEGVVRLCSTDLAHLATEPRSAVARTVLGPLTVRSEPPPPLPEALVDGFEHAVTFQIVTEHHDERPEEESPAVLVKARKQDAERLARKLDHIDGISIETGPAGTLGIRMWEGETDRGLLCLVPVDAEEAALARSARTMMLGIAGGGPSRALRDSDFVRQMRLSVRSHRADTARHDPVFDEPPERWPKITDALTRLAQTVFGAECATWPIEDLHGAVTLVGAIWNAIVYADFTGDSDLLDQARQMMAKDAETARALEAIARAKRQQFPGDPRITGEIEVIERGGEPRIIAKWTVVPGYAVGGMP